MEELPGFYYDPLKNRYFPLKGPIPGASASKSAAPPPSSPPSHSQQTPGPAGARSNSKTIKLTRLLHLRQIHGPRFFSDSTPHCFHTHYPLIPASQPAVFKFEGTKNVQSAIARMSVQLQTQTGTSDALFLVTGRAHGYLSFFQLDNPEGDHLDVQTVWSPHLKKKHTSSSAHFAAPSLSLCRNVHFSSDISSVKLHAGLHGRALYPSLHFNILPRLNCFTSSFLILDQPF